MTAKTRLPPLQIQRLAQRATSHYPREVEFTKDSLLAQVGDLLRQLGWRKDPPSIATLNRWLNALNIDPAQPSFDRDELRDLLILGGWYRSYHRDGAAKYRAWRSQTANRSPGDQQPC